MGQTGVGPGEGHKDDLRAGDAGLGGKTKAAGSLLPLNPSPALQYQHSLPLCPRGDTRKRQRAMGANHTRGLSIPM